MESRRIAFAFGAVVGLSAALLSGRYARWRQSNGGEQLQRVDQQDVNAEANVGDTVAQLEGSPPQLLSSSTKYFKYGAPVSHLSSHTYAAHTLTYDRSKKIPMWVAEVISRDMVNSNIANRKHSRFRPDPDVLPCHSAANEDYRGSGWSRGHMAPAGNYKTCQKSMDNTFYLTNILPQDIDNNSGYWNRLEGYCRELTERYDEVSIISGPLFLPEKDEKTGKSFVRYELIGENGVAVPTHLFKIILAEGKKVESGTSANQSPAMGVFVIPNEKIGNVDLTRFQVGLEKLEAYTGTTFHSKLDRSKVQDLCVADTCRLMSVEKIVLYSYTKKLNSCKTRQELEDYWGEMIGKDIKPDDVIKQTYKRKIEQFENVNKS